MSQNDTTIPDEPMEELILSFDADPGIELQEPLMARAPTAAGRSTDMADTNTISGKHERRDLMYFASFDGTTWEVLGVDNDDLSKELNPDVEKGKNVLGESTFKHRGYEPEISVDPYYADTTSTLYEKLKSAAIQEKYSDADIKGYFVEVCYSTATETTLSGTGYKRAAYIVPQSTGGDTTGLGIPFTVNPIGPQTPVTVTYTIADRSVTIAAST